MVFLGCFVFLFCYYATLLFLPAHSGILLDCLQEFLESRKNQQVPEALLTSAPSLSLIKSSFLDY